MFTRLLSVALLLCALPTCAQSVPEPKLGSNLVENAGFENGATLWIIPDDTAKVVNEHAHSGKSSLFYTNADPARYKLFSQKLAVQPGQHLLFSVWVKGQDITGKQGAGLCMESYDVRGNYIDGSYPQTLPGSYDWKQARGEYLVPATAAHTSVTLYLRKATIGSAWFDDVEVRVEQPVPVISILQYPNYRGMVTQDNTAPWKFSVHVNGQTNWKKAPLKIDTVLTDSKGKVLLDESREVDASDKKIAIVLSAPANLPIGNYSLRQTIVDPNGEVTAQQDHPIQIVPQMPKVYIDEQGFTVANDKRFFPLGVYLSPADDEDLQRISEGGFNTILSYWYGSRDSEAYLESALKNNLKVIYSVKDMYPGMKPTSPPTLDKAAGYITSLKDNPALLAWYINDELGSEWLPKLQQMYTQVKQLDPNHPAFQVLYQIGILQKYFDITEVLGTDPYPVGSANLAQTSSNTQITRAATRGARGVWMVPQIMDWAVYHGDRKHHPPTLDEMRNQAYQALINGAKGLIFYSYFDLWFADSNRRPDNAAFDKRWPDVTAMAREIKALTPAILLDKEVPLTLPTGAQVQAGAWEYQNKLLILLANPYYQHEKITFAVPAGWKIIQSEQGEIKSTFLKGQVTFTLPSVGSGVFQLVKN